MLRVLEMYILAEESRIKVCSVVKAVVLGSAMQSVYPLGLIFVVGFFLISLFVQLVLEDEVAWRGTSLLLRDLSGCWIYQLTVCDLVS